MAQDNERLDLDLPIGVLLGLLGGAVFGILYAPKAGQELQTDIQDFVTQLPGGLNQGLSKSKVKYKELVGKTKEGITVQLEQRKQQKRAARMAKAKHREAVEAGFDL